eukprot:12102653-Alexandrium_andersonii.AAC.2
MRGHVSHHDASHPDRVGPLEPRLRQPLLAFRVTRRPASHKVSGRLSRRGEGMRGAYPDQQLETLMPLRTAWLVSTTHP